MGCHRGGRGGSGQSLGVLQARCAAALRSGVSLYGCGRGLLESGCGQPSWGCGGEGVVEVGGRSGGGRGGQGEGVGCPGRCLGVGTFCQDWPTENKKTTNSQLSVKLR